MIPKYLQYKYTKCFLCITVCDWLVWWWGYCPLSFLVSILESVCDSSAIIYEREVEMWKFQEIPPEGWLLSKTSREFVICTPFVHRARCRPSTSISLILDVDLCRTTLDNFLSSEMSLQRQKTTCKRQLIKEKYFHRKRILP